MARSSGTLSFSICAAAASRFFLPAEGGLGLGFSGTLPKPLPAIIAAGATRCVLLWWTKLLHDGLVKPAPARTSASMVLGFPRDLRPFREAEGDRQRTFALKVLGKKRNKTTQLKRSI